MNSHIHTQGRGKHAQVQSCQWCRPDPLSQGCDGCPLASPEQPGQPAPPPRLSQEGEICPGEETDRLGDKTPIAGTRTAAATAPRTGHGDGVGREPCCPSVCACGSVLVLPTWSPGRQGALGRAQVQTASPDWKRLMPGQHQAFCKSQSQCAESATTACTVAPQDEVTSRTGGFMQTLLTGTGVARLL